MKTFESIISELNEKLTVEQIQLIKDTINYGGWGDTEIGFMDENGNGVTAYAFGYFTNEAKRAGHFEGRKISAMFRSIYSRLGMNQYKGEGQNEYFCHISNWWGDGSGDVFFIRSNRSENGGVALYEQFEEWARS